MRPFLLVPKSPNLLRAFDDLDDAESAVIVIAPRDTTPGMLMAACRVWPRELRARRIHRVAVVLGVSAYVTAEPILQVCKGCFERQRLDVAYFHEGQLESDHIDAWFEQRKPRRRVTTDSMMKLMERYLERGDAIGAAHAITLATLAA